MKFKFPHLTLAEIAAVIAITGVIIGAIISGQAIFSPGSLNAQIAHNQLLGGVSTHAALSGQCGACHPAPWQKTSMAELCLKCHENVAKEIQDPHDLHSMAVRSNQTLTCTSDCHTEHNGTNALLTLVKGEHFVNTELATGKLQFSTKGHQFQSPGIPFTCVDCHPDTLDTFDVSTCATCHQKLDPTYMTVHIDTFGDGCLKCHDGIDTYGKAFDHNQAPFTLRGIHASASTACGDCHEHQSTPQALKNTPKDCLSCHRDETKHNSTISQDCNQCHDEVAWKQMTFVTHNTTNYPLTGKHEQAACTKCHADDLYKGAPTDCNSCHKNDDKHQGNLGTDCVQCHETTGWKSIIYDHDTSEYKLIGKHQTTDCTACHTDSKLKETPQDCASCHKTDDKHEGNLGQKCADCHDTTGWDKILFDHATSTFALTGSHITTGCTQCHQQGVLKDTPSDCNSCHKTDDKHNGVYGTNCTQCHGVVTWTQLTVDHAILSFTLTGKHVTALCNTCHVNGVFKGTAKDCYSCHKTKDIHSGSLGTNCVACHTTNGWPTTTIDHVGLTAFALTGKHTTVSCASCHVSGVYKGTPKDCFSCHRTRDTHNGSNGTNCISCHNTIDWKAATINHATTAFPLTGKHATVACASCHVNGVYKGTPKDCYSCHKAKDLHVGSLGTSCATCHTTTGWPTTTIDHVALTAFSLTGKHITVACASCHVNGVYKGTPKDCYSCHKAKDTHNGTNGTNCASCHNTAAWTQATVNHATTAFPLTGKHSTVACVSCHVNGIYKGTPKDCYSCHKAKDLHAGSLGTNCAACHTTAGWPTTTIDHVALTAFSLTGNHTTVACASCHVNGVYKGTPKDCYSCHKSKDPHSGTNGTNCASCHNTSNWTQVTVNHANTAFPLTGKHTTTVCASCHVNNVYKGTPTDCYSCHKAKDPHNGTNGTNCASCHNTTDWTQATVNHATTAFPLTGKHTTVACASCHVNNVYKGTPTDCYSCHKTRDIHAGSLGTTCATCHTTTGWPTTTIDHVALTAFSLTGKHTTVACASCHVNGVYKGTPKDCYSCHKAKDPHNGTNGTNCASCHNTTDWTQAVVNHATTAFPLTGKHTTVACALCHVNNVYKGTPTDCYSCHKTRDIHAGAQGTNCATCHTTAGWPTTTINHTTQTSFPLTGKHTTVACASCHVNGVYKGTPKDCYSCHKARDLHAGSLGTNCATCHTTTGWPTTTIDHVNLTAFPLIGRHTSVACASCHLNGVYKGTAKDCYSCHARDDDHNGRNGTDCGRCHNPRGW